jgi:BASS family bile acid:Na+ symporter
LNLPPAVATGLAVLAAAPGAPMTYKRTQMAGGDPNYAASLQLILALLAVVITPLTLAIFYAPFDLVTERVPPFKVALQVGKVTFLPVIIGLLIQHFSPGIARRIGKPVQTLANALFLIFVLFLIALLVVAPDLRAKLNIGGPGITAIVIMVVFSLVGGHILGGPLREQRPVLAIGCIARNAGLAFFIAGLSDYGQQFTPTLLTYVILGSALAIPYSVWSKRQSKKAK